MKHRASKEFRKPFEALPAPIQDLARKNFDLLKQDPAHPSLRFKKIGRLHSSESVSGIGHSAWRARMDCSGCWIGPHTDYDKLLP